MPMRIRFLVIAFVLAAPIPFVGCVIGPKHEDPAEPPSVSDTGGGAGDSSFTADSSTPPAETSPGGDTGTAALDGAPTADNCGDGAVDGDAGADAVCGDGPDASDADASDADVDVADALKGG